MRNYIDDNPKLFVPSFQKTMPDVDSSKMKTYEEEDDNAHTAISLAEY